MTADVESISTGVRIPTQGFTTAGTGKTSEGYPPHPYETFAYDSALFDAKIADFNIVPYTSVLPSNLELVPIAQAQQGPSWVHGAVLEVIMAAVGISYSTQGNGNRVGLRRHGRSYIAEVDDAVVAAGSMLGIMTGVKDKSGNVVGGYVAEYVGVYSSDIGAEAATTQGRDQLGKSMDHEIAIRNLDPNSGARTFTDVAYIAADETNRFAYTLNAIGFTRFTFADAPTTA